MKNTKSFRTDRSRNAQGGDRRPAAKPARGKAPLRDEEKPRFGDKPKFGDKPRFGEKPKFGAKPKFGDKSKPAFRKPDFKKPSGKPAPEQREAFVAAPNSVLIWGLHAARAAWLNPKRRITRAWLTEAGKKSFEATQNEAHEELLKRPDAKITDRDALDKMTPSNSVHQGIIIETTALPEPTLHDIIGKDTPPDLILMLDQVTDPHNVGAILRSAAAFGAGAIVMTERNAPTTTGVLAKSASGALEVTPMIHVVNLARAIDDLREAGYWCVGLAEEGEKNLAQLDMSGRTVIILGAEGDGLRHLTRQKCDELARLPTGGAIGSLNVSNAAAVALYEVRRQSKV